MHDFTMPQWAIDRVMQRRDKLHVHDDMDPRRTALIVVDLQNGFMVPCSHTLEARQIERHHVEAPTMSCCVLPHFVRGRIRFVQIACRADYLSAMRGERTRGLHSETRRHTCNEHSLALKIYSRQNLICR
jgi:hypothetical protein